MATKQADGPMIVGQCKSLMQEIAALRGKRDKYDLVKDEKLRPILAQYQASVEPITEELKTKEEKLEALCNEHRNLIFTGDEKTLKTPFGSFGFRMGGEKLILDDEESEVIALIRKSAKKFADVFVVIKESISKTAIKKAVASGEIKPEKLTAMSMHLEREEKFFIN